MKILENEFRVGFDVDDTLIMHEPNDPKAISIVNPYTNIVYKVVPHKEHIATLMEHKAKGYEVTVWSARGKKWAAAVAKALKLEKYVDFAAAKYVKHFDDQETGILGTRVYIPFKKD